MQALGSQTLWKGGGCKLIFLIAHRSIPKLVGLWVCSPLKVRTFETASGGY